MEEIRASSSRQKRPLPFSSNERPVRNILKSLSFRWARGSQRRSFFAILLLTVTIVSLVWNARLSVALAKERTLRAEFANLVDQQELVLK
jgi:hypothetical protein